MSIRSSPPYTPIKTSNDFNEKRLAKPPGKSEHTTTPDGGYLIIPRGRKMLQSLD